MLCSKRQTFWKRLQSRSDGSIGYFKASLYQTRLVPQPAASCVRQGSLLSRQFVYQEALRGLTALGHELSVQCFRRSFRLLLITYAFSKSGPKLDQAVAETTGIRRQKKMDHWKSVTHGVPSAICILAESACTDTRFLWQCELVASSTSSHALCD